jgi:tetratricopeptide (TPR) repeat protein
LNGKSDEIRDEQLSARLAYIAAMERAYMLQGTQDPDSLLEAQRIYTDRLNTHPRDVSALFRLGQVLVEQERLDEAKERFEKAISTIEDGTAENIDEARSRVYDFVRLNLALVYWRYYERRTLPADVRHENIKQALNLSKPVVEKGFTTEGRQAGLNAFLYYAWEERALAKSHHLDTSLSIDEFMRLTSQFEKHIAETADITFRKLDTLARACAEIGNDVAAAAAGRRVCLQLEEAAQKRSGGLPNLAAERFGGRWGALVMKHLINEDERDALAFALSPPSLHEIVRDPKRGS